MNDDPTTAAGNGATRPRISVVLPMYNAARYLPACLDSLLAQNMGDFEIIAVDDASTDSTNEIISGYAARDSRVRWTRHEKNANSFATRLTALDRVAGDYIFCCDSDDIVPPDAFTRLLDKAERSGADVVHGRTLLLSDAGLGEPAYWVEPFRVVTGTEFVLAMLRNRRGWNVWAKLFSRRAVERALPAFPRGRHWFTLDDLLTSCLFGLHSDGYAAVDAPVYHYRIPPVTHSVRSGGYAKWAGDSLGVLSFLEEAVVGHRNEKMLRGCVGGFMRDCITGLVSETSASPEGHAQVVEKIKTTVSPEYAGWAEERGMLEFGRIVRKGKAERIREAVGRIRDRGMRETYLRLRTKLLFNRWEREYRAAEARR